jgi:hydrogenase 3 maturation protease
MLELLRKRLDGRVVILGVGNTLRGDDGAGPYLVKELESEAGAVVLDCGEVPENFLGKVAENRPDNVLIIDAADLGANPGAVAVLEEEELAGTGWSTHRFPLKHFVSYLKADTGSNVTVVGIQPKSTGFGTALSAEVKETVGLLRRTIQEVLAARRQAPRS